VKEGSILGKKYDASMTKSLDDQN